MVCNNVISYFFFLLGSLYHVDVNNIRGNYFFFNIVH